MTQKPMRTRLPERLSSRSRWMLAAVLAASAAVYLLTIPRHLFEDTPYSTVVLDSGGELLGARIAADEQWRFPPSGEVPEKYEKALVQFEDRAFYWHGGVNPISVVRALGQNLREGRVVSGGSTITMQLVRMARGGERNLRNKLYEACVANRLEQVHSKKWILSMYASHAPFGGNVVGIEAASWRYFGHQAHELSWGEAALLAVLPNAPSSMHVGKNRDSLMEKRNRLLLRLHEKGYLDDTDFMLACEEPLPSEPQPLPQLAPHLVAGLAMSHGGQTVSTDIDISLQSRVQNITDGWNEQLRLSGVNDLAAVVVDVHSGRVLAYVGNANAFDGRPGSQVDIVRAPRSTGSILKPFLYCALLQEGEILPNTLLPDVPVNINGFSPQNFDMQFNGAVHASEALARSLNVPAVHMLRRYGVPRFKDMLETAGMTTLTRDASVYGLSLILGGAEGSLEDMTTMYAAMSAVFQGYEWEDGALDTFPLKDRLSIYWTFDALKEVNRPDEMDWRLISSVRKVAWKTGTSYGFRDAWAIGVTADYAVGVWAGNAQGQGSAGLVGARTAGPVLFDIFNVLPASDWFEEPMVSEGVLAEVCHESGRLAGLYCEHPDTLLLPANAMRSEPCTYHRLVTLSSDGSCMTDADDPDASVRTMFVLPPSMEWYYRTRHPEYMPLPPVKHGAVMNDSFNVMEFIYPEAGSVISIPRQLDGSVKGIVFNLAHTDPDTDVFWHLDDGFVGTTKYLHQMRLTPEPGRHSVTVVDENGSSLSISFTIEAGDR